MKTYPTYKDSGQLWLGLIPEHWRTVPTFVVLQERQVPNIGMREKTLLSLSYGRIVVKDIDSAFGLLPASFETYQIVKPGNIILRFTDLQNDHKSLRVGLAKNDGIITSAYLCLSVNQSLLPEYAYQQLHAIDTQKLFYSMGGGLRQSMGYDDLRRMPFLVPPADEQAAIVAYLDRKSADIERFITKKRRLIALLNEQKAAIINRAVTKGLTPDVPMKASGVEWLGRVPAHWEVRKISRSFRRISSGTTPPSGETRYYEGGTVAWVNTGDLNDDWLTSCKHKLTELALTNFSTLKIYEPGTLLVALYGATIGKTAILGFPACTNQACCALSSSPFFDIRFVKNWFVANKVNIVSLGYGGGQPNISQELVRQLRVPCPPPNEQVAIVAYIEAENAIIGQAISRVEQEIELIQEYQTTLISDAVTGKIDVREVTDAKNSAANLMT